MSRQRTPMLDGTLLVVGWDGGNDTWFAIHYDSRDEQAPPRVAIGYSPAEQALLRAERPDAIVGPFPVDDLEEMLTKLIPDLAGLEPAPNQSMCWNCGKPPWHSNRECPGHPYDRLRSW